MRSYRYTFQGALEISENGFTMQYFQYNKKDADKKFTADKKEHELYSEKYFYRNTLLSSIALSHIYNKNDKYYYCTIVYYHDKRIIRKCFTMFNTMQDAINDASNDYKKLDLSQFI